MGPGAPFPGPNVTLPQGVTLPSVPQVAVPGGGPEVVRREPNPELAAAAANPGGGFAFRQPLADQLSRLRGLLPVNFGFRRPWV